MKYKIGMVIVNYNDAKTTKKLINNIKNYECLSKIVIVDNSSTDDSIKELKKLENNKIILIEKKQNKGYASGMNAGAKYLVETLGHCHIIFSNSDIIIEKEEDLKQLSENISSKIAVVGPTILEHGNYNRGWRLTNAKMEILFNLPWISRYLIKKLLYYNENHYEKKQSTVDVVSGCFFLVDSKVLEQVNYFDEKTFLYYEELILAQKMKRLGKKEVIDNQVTIIHDHSVTIDKNVKRINKYKILKTSQKYYVENYLDPNSFQKILLFLTNKLSLGILHIRCLIGGRK